MAAVLLVAMIGVVYGQTVAHPFITFDDEAYVSGNPRVGRGLTGSGVAWAFSTLSIGNYHPLTWLSHMADVTLFGLDAGSHHLVNVFFHALNSVFLAYVLFRMTGAILRSALAASLFAVHPLHVESVAWVAERKDVLCTFFFILTLLAYVSFVERRTLGRYMAVFLLMAMGLLSKPMLVTLPFVLLLLDYWPLGRLTPAGGGARGTNPGSIPLSRRSIVLEKVPLAGLSVAACAVTLIAQTAAGATDVFNVYPIGYRVGNALISYGAYLAKTFWPSSLAVYYPFPAKGLAAWKIAAAGAAVLSATALAARQARKRPFLAVGWLWYLGTLVPVIGIVQVGEQAMADRYTYIPLIGIFIALVWGVSELSSRSPGRSRFLAATGGAAFVALTFISWVQAGHWRSSADLYEHALEVTSDNWMMHNNLGVVRYREGKADAALAHYAESVRIEPNFAKSNFNLGETLLVGGNTRQAVRYLRRAVDLAPGNAIMRLVLGTALARQGNFDDALLHLREAARLDPADREIERELRVVSSRRAAEVDRGGR